MELRCELVCMHIVLTFTVNLRVDGLQPVIFVQNNFGHADIGRNNHIARKIFLLKQRHADFGLNGPEDRILTNRLQFFRGLQFVPRNFGKQHNRPCSLFQIVGSTVKFHFPVVFIAHGVFEILRGKFAQYLDVLIHKTYPPMVYWSRTL